MLAPARLMGYTLYVIPYTIYISSSVQLYLCTALQETDGRKILRRCSHRLVYCSKEANLVTALSRASRSTHPFSTMRTCVVFLYPCFVRFYAYYYFQVPIPKSCSGRTCRYIISLSTCIRYWYLKTCTTVVQNKPVLSSKNKSVRGTIVQRI